MTVILRSLVVIFGGVFVGSNSSSVFFHRFFILYFNNEHIGVPWKSIAVVEQGRTGNDMHRILLIAVRYGTSVHLIVQRNAKKLHSPSAFWRASIQRASMCV